MKQLLIILFVLLLIGCGSRFQSVEGPTGQPGPQGEKGEDGQDYLPVEETVYQGIYNIGNSQLVVLKDEDNKIDLLASYLWIENIDNTMGKVYINATNLRVVDNAITYTSTIQETQLNTYLFNIKDTIGNNLVNDPHILIVNITFNDILELSLTLLDEDGLIVLEKTLKEVK